MKATIVDLRYKMKDVLGALRRRENIEILYHGKPIGKIVPLNAGRKKKDLKNHPFFRLRKGDKEPVESIMERLRAPRYRDI